MDNIQKECSVHLTLSFHAKYAQMQNSIKILLSYRRELSPSTFYNREPVYRHLFDTCMAEMAACKKCIFVPLYQFRIFFFSWWRPFRQSGMRDKLNEKLKGNMKRPEGFVILKKEKSLPMKVHTNASIKMRTFLFLCLFGTWSPRIFHESIRNITFYDISRFREKIDIKDLAQNR